MEPKKKSFLRDFRKSNGLTAKLLAGKIGVFPHYITRIEYGNISCGELMARRLGEYFEMDWKLFLTDKYE